MATTAFEMENTRALSDPTLRARFSLSFSAQMMLSQESVKESCAAAANALLSFSGVRYRTAWTGIYFTAGGKRIAALAFFEDSLCLLLAQSAEAASGPRYKAQDVSQLRRFEKTPALLPLKSEGALKNALKKWADLAATLDLREKDAPAAVFAPESFPGDSFESLLRRGLIRPTGKYSGEEGAFVEVLSALSAGEATIKLSEKKMLRALDEGWVERIEQALPAIDELLRRPSHFIAETEEIRPMELTRKITGRSVAHLCQHTDFISSVDGDEVTPSKMLNIIREDSILTYENKFLNTLLANLYFFVSERYRIALENGVDERISSVRFTDSFYHGQAKSLVTINIQRSEKITDAKGVQKSYFGSRLWKRVEQLNDITRAYIESDFVREMGQLGVYADVSHLSDPGFWDLFRMTERPVVASHSNARALCPHRRNLTDDMFRAIRDTGGVVGINLYADFVGGDSMEQLIAHIERFLSLDGEKTVALGGDLDGCEALAAGFSGVQDVAKLYQALEERGYPQTLLEDIFWNNWRRIL